MNHAPPKAYNELVDRILPHEDRVRLETVIGAMLSEGPVETVVISGSPATGKTTLMKIIKRLVTLTVVGRGAPRVLFQHDNVTFKPVELAHPTFIFAEALDPTAPPGVICIQTTGDRLPVTKYYALMQQIDSELDDIAEHCIQTYQNNLENNR